MGNKQARPSIPPYIQHELWGRAAGRCEFRGCNKLLYKDDLTQQRSNLAIISHIVSYSPEGPRGDPVRSKQLETDGANLMLTCRDHGKIIDDKHLEHEYPEVLLREFKREHEDRIRLLTDIREDARTHVLLVQAPIDGKDFAIRPADAFQAILPKYPAEERLQVIDLTSTAVRADSDGFFPLLADSITQQIQGFLARRGGSRVTHLSVFALAPIPLLAHLGHLLGDIECVDLYQRHQDTQNWKWQDEDANEVFYDLHRPDSVNGDGRVALMLSISEPVNRARVTATVGADALIYELQAHEPSRDFLRTRKHLELFGYEIRKLLFELRDTYDHNRPVHVFAAVPAPVAIQLGRSIKECDSPFIMYEYHKAVRAFAPALTINPRRNC